MKPKPMTETSDRTAVPLNRPGLQEYQGQNPEMVEYFAGDGKIPPQRAADYEKVRAERGDELYSDLLLGLIHRRFSPQEAKMLWRDIVVHKYFMSEKMGRNVGVKVAVLDYLDNFSGRMKDLRLLSENDLNSLLLFVNEDGLTGLYNHRYFQEQLREELTRCRRYNRTFSLLFVDIDHFKAYNDSLGHRKGDLLLQEIADYFKSAVREADTVARYGGDEFAFILPETNVREAVTFAERLQAGFCQQAFGAKEKSFRRLVTISIGVANYPADANVAEEVIQVADQALYRAKRGGRNAIRKAGASRKPSH